LEITVTGADGQVFNTVRGPASAGLHIVNWNMRGEAPPAPEPGPFEKQEREKIAARARVVTDSLKEAGWDAPFLDRMTGMFTGETSRNQMFAMFMGGGAGGGDPEAFRERPGESRGGGGFDFGQMRELASLIMPGVGLGTLFNRLGRGGGGEAPLAEPGSYTLTLKAGDRSFTQTLTVDRVGGLTGNSSPFESQWAALVRRLDRMR
jgi:hypothetical protein